MVSDPIEWRCCNSAHDPTVSASHRVPNESLLIGDRIVLSQHDRDIGLFTIAGGPFILVPYPDESYYELDPVPRRGVVIEIWFCNKCPRMVCNGHTRIFVPFSMIRHATSTLLTREAAIWP